MKNNQFITRNSIKVLLVLAALSIFVTSCITQRAEKIDPTITADERNLPTVQNISNKSFETFLHTVEEHKKFDCVSCHSRKENSYNLKFPGHNSCISCHLNEFTNPKSGICTTCHDDMKAVPVTMKPFPSRFKESFNMRFEHSAHISGAGRPNAGCASCHQPQGAGKSIPIGIYSHANCFTCHTEQSNIGSCNYCHKTAPYRRTVPGRTIFKAVFSHQDHTSSQGVSCNECHSVRAGAPQSQQVTAAVAIQHSSAGGAVSCRTCHNDQRAFGEANFANCKRCHTGPGFDMFP